VCVCACVCERVDVFAHFVMSVCVCVCISTITRTLPFSFRLFHRFANFLFFFDYNTDFAIFAYLRDWFFEDLSVTPHSLPSSTPDCSCRYFTPFQIHCTKLTPFQLPSTWCSRTVPLINVCLRSNLRKKRF